jgi:hypothetical protein
MVVMVAASILPDNSPFIAVYFPSYSLIARWSPVRLRPPAALVHCFWTIYQLDPCFFGFLFYILAYRIPTFWL